MDPVPPVDDDAERGKGGKAGKGGATALKESQQARSKKAKQDGAQAGDPQAQFDPLRNLDVLAAAALAQAGVDGAPRAGGVGAGPAAPPSGSPSSAKARQAAGSAGSAAPTVAAHPPAVAPALAARTRATSLAAAGQALGTDCQHAPALSGGAGQPATAQPTPATSAGGLVPPAQAAAALAATASSAGATASRGVPVPTKPRSRRPLPQHIATQRQTGGALPGADGADAPGDDMAADEALAAEGALPDSPEATPEDPGLHMQGQQPPTAEAEGGGPAVELPGGGLGADLAAPHLTGLHDGASGDGSGAAAADPGTVLTGAAVGGGPGSSSLSMQPGPQPHGAAVAGHAAEPMSFTEQLADGPGGLHAGQGDPLAAAEGLHVGSVGGPVPQLALPPVPTDVPPGGLTGLTSIDSNPDNQLMVASIISVALANHEATMTGGAAGAGGGLGPLGGLGSLGAGSLSDLLFGAGGGASLGAGLGMGDAGSAFLTAAAAMGADPADPSRKLPGRRRAHASSEDEDATDEDATDDEGGRRRERSRATAQRRGNEVANRSNKVTFDEGMRLADGRIYVPLPFVHQNLADAEFPVRLPADIVVNGETISENYQVRIARSQNKTRRHGLGNHWVTGHQRLIKNYKDVRLTALELVDRSRLRIVLTASGSWDDAASSAPAASAGGGLAGTASALAGSGLQSLLGMGGGAGLLGPGRMDGTLDLATLLAMQAAAGQSLGPLAGAGAPGSFLSMLGGGLQGGALGGGGGLLGPALGLNLAGGGQAGEAGPSGQGGELPDVPLGARGGSADPGGAQGPGTWDMASTLGVALAGAPEGAAARGRESAEGEEGEGGGPGSSTGPGAAGQTWSAAVQQAAGAMGGSLPGAPPQPQAQGGPAGGEQQAGGGSMQPRPPDNPGAADGAQGGAGPSAEGVAAGLAAVQALMAPGVPPGGAGPGAGAGAQLGLGSNLLVPLGGGQEGISPAMAAAVAAAAGGMAGMGQLGGLPYPLSTELLATAAATGQWGMDAVQSLLANMGPVGLFGMTRAPPLGPAPPTTLSSATAGSQHHPRLYDGRIHVPLNIINAHFPNQEFPVNITTKLLINNEVAGDNLTARIVKYKKHKRPNHFNFWITGLQKTLSRFNDVRQAGVQMEHNGVMLVKLLAANSAS